MFFLQNFSKKILKIKCSKKINFYQKNKLRSKNWVKLTKKKPVTW